VLILFLTLSALSAEEAEVSLAVVPRMVVQVVALGILLVVQAQEQRVRDSAVVLALMLHLPSLEVVEVALHRLVGTLPQRFLGLVVTVLPPQSQVLQSLALAGGQGPVIPEWAQVASVGAERAVRSMVLRIQAVGARPLRFQERVVQVL